MSLARKQLIDRAFIVALTILTLVWVWKQRAFPLLQLRTLIIALVIYLIWAAVHHYFDKSLTLAVYVEYLLTATLALILLLGVLL